MNQYQQIAKPRNRLRQVEARLAIYESTAICISEISITVSCHKINLNKAGLIIDTINANPMSRTLILKDSLVQSTGSYLFEKLAANMTIHTIIIDKCKFEPQCSNAMASMLSHNKTLQTLKLISVVFCDDIKEVNLIVNSLYINSTLLNLCLRNIHIGDEGVIDVANMLVSNSSLQEVCLIRASITDKGAVAIANALSTNSTLLVLKLSANYITDDGAIELARVITNNQSLRTLILSCNYITGESSEAVTQMLALNTTLTHLSLAKNDIDADAALVIINALLTNKTLNRINLCENLFGYTKDELLIHRNMVNVLNTESDDWITSVKNILEHNYALIDISIGCKYFDPMQIITERNKALATNRRFATVKAIVE